MVLGSDRWVWDEFPLGMWQANCGILADRETGGAIVFDPGQDAGPVVRERLDAQGLSCEAILLTHGHLDHLWAAPELATALDVLVLLHDDDRWLWDDPAAAFGDLPPGALEAQFGLSWDPPTERLEPLRDHQRLHLAGVRIDVAHTPGHTPGSCVFVVHGEADEPLLVSGDLIFAGSVGRTDLPRGSSEQLLESIRRVVLPLDDAVEIHSGHGPVTTVGAERRGNPFLREIV